MPSYTDYINDSEIIWKEGLDKLFDRFKDEHEAKMDEIGIKYNADDKIFLSPSKASIIMNYNGVPMLEGKCHRQMFFRHFGITETNETPMRSKMKMLGGIAIEEFEHRVEIESGKQVARNETLAYEVNDDAIILGVVDSIMEDSWGNRYVKEIKSIYGYMATRNIIKGTKTIIPQPRISAVLQLMLYITILEIDYGILKFIDATTLADSKSYVIELGEETMGEGLVDYYAIINGEERRDITISGIMERYMRYVSYIKSKQLPPRDCSVEYDNTTVEKLYEVGKISKKAYTEHISGKAKTGDWQCSMCEYRDLCMMQDDEIEKIVMPAIHEKEILY